MSDRPGSLAFQTNGVFVVGILRLAHERDLLVGLHHRSVAAGADEFGLDFPE